MTKILEQKREDVDFNAAIHYNIIAKFQPGVTLFKPTLITSLSYWTITG